MQMEAKGLDMKQSAQKPKSSSERQYEWNEVGLSGRFSAGNNEEYTCDIDQISPVGMMCSSGEKIVPPTGAGIILYVDVLGRFAGTVICSKGNQFQIELKLTSLKRLRLAEKLAELKVNGVPELPELPEQQQLEMAPKMLVTEDGVAHACSVVNMSMWGAFVKTEARPRTGSRVTLGKITGTVSRQDKNGLRIAFPVLHERRKTPR